MDTVATARRRRPRHPERRSLVALISNPSAELALGQSEGTKTALQPSPVRPPVEGADEPTEHGQKPAPALSRRLAADEQLGRERQTTGDRIAPVGSPRDAGFWHGDLSPCPPAAPV